MLDAQKQNKLIKQDCAQRFKLLDELQAVNKKNAILKEQLANGVASVTSMANVADAANYSLHRIEPEKQLTGTNPLAFSPWKWAVNNKFCVDSVIFLTKENKISYAFHQLD